MVSDLQSISYVLVFVVSITFIFAGINGLYKEIFQEKEETPLDKF